MCNKKVCLNCLMKHNNNCKEKKIENELKDIGLDIINKKKNSSCIKNYEDKKGRNFGIDLLKIYSMINIVLYIHLHMEKLFIQINIQKIIIFHGYLTTFSYSAVNTFGLISGYLMINMEFN